jgi:UDP-N-acetylglucosamine 2-epimerase (non-hydrolysing)
MHIMKHCLILGTRPEIIKMGPIIKRLENLKVDYFIIHSNQHYSKNMDKIFFKELGLPNPRYHLSVRSGTHATQTAKILIRTEKILLAEKPDIVYVQGDTNTAMAGALAAQKVGIKIAHIEAGLRSFDRTMPEEINRIIIDHVSDFLFAPTKRSQKNLRNEMANKEKIFVVGNTIVDAVMDNVKKIKNNPEIARELNIKSKKYILLTLHRPSNVDGEENLTEILTGLDLIYKKFKLPIIFPVHPRTRKRNMSFKVTTPKGIIMINPVGFHDFLWLERNAKLILTDSGGVQEEACILKVPCVTIRENTERPETIEAKSNLIAGISAKNIFCSAKIMMDQKPVWKNPFGNGKSARNIVKTILTKL